MDFKTKVSELMALGYKRASARAKIAHDVVLAAIKASGMKDSVTIKGGVVMSEITKEVRRATMDMDADFVHYTLGNVAVKKFVANLDKHSDCTIEIKGDVVDLKQQEYRGKRIFLQITDDAGYKVITKVDLGLFGEIYRPELISHDHYQFNNNGDTGNYFLNLGIIRQSAAAQGIPFWNGVQACGWKWAGGRASPNSPRIPGVAELRYCAFTTAAYGAHGIYYFVYCRGGHDGGIAEIDGTTGEKYEAIKTINREFVAIARVLSELEFTGAYFQGVHAPGTTPYCGQALLKITPETPYSELVPPSQLVGTTLVSRFEGTDKPTHLMVVNCDYQNERTLHIRAPRPAERFDPASGKWSLVGDEFDLALLRGGGVLLRLDRRQWKNR